MATAKPRITVTLTQRQHDVLRSISDYGGQSMSSFIGELLEQSLPVLERMAESFRKINEQRKRIVEELDQAQAEVEPVLEQVLGQFDLFMSKVEKAAAGAGAPDALQRAAAPAPADARTPVTNRGVTPTPVNPPKRPRHKASGPISSEKVLQKKSRG